MSTAPQADAAAPKKGSKKIIIIAVALLVVGAAGAGGFVYFKQKAAAEAAAAEDGEEAPPAELAQSGKPKLPPTFLPLENMVVNLADPGGDRFAQVGVTLEISDPKAAESIKGFLPTIRNGILLAISQRTAEELLGREGKDKLAKDILREVSEPLGYPVEEDEEPAAEGSKPKKKKKPKGFNPVQAVLFSSFIVQ